MEQDLREAKAKAEHAAAAKNTFLANMSHEIRTPMNAILGFTDVLLDETLSDTQRRHLKTVRTSAKSLLSLLNDILDTAKLERGAVDLEIADFSLRDVCMHVLASLRVNAQHKTLPIILDYPNEVPDFFKGDALRIQQILINLVGNAIKFTEQGHVRLGVCYQNARLTLNVEDSGIGIAPDRLDHIFNPFAQADASMSRRFGGTGLGTSISKQLIELMGGRIWVESELGVGSNFHVELPLLLGTPVSVADNQSQQVAVDLPTLRILAADDVPQNLELLEILLQRDGHSLHTVHNGEEALAAAREQRFDLILMDVQMPIMNGLEASQAIRLFESQQNKKRTPIIALSASVLQADVQAALDAGMDGFVHKPVELTMLKLEIAKLLKIPTLASKPRLVSPEGTDLAAPLPYLQGSVIDWSRGKQLWGNEQRYQQALEQFTYEFAGTANDLRRLYDKPSSQADLSATLHKVKGAAANLSLPRLTQLLAQMEQILSQEHEPEQQRIMRLRIHLDQLADEFNNLEESVLALKTSHSTKIQPQVSLIKHTPQETLDYLDQLDLSLQRGEFNELALQSLELRLTSQEFAKLDATVNAFDFDAARDLIAVFTANYTQNLQRLEVTTPTSAPPFQGS